jgi:hypothetical protein
VEMANGLMIDIQCSEKIGSPFLALNWNMIKWNQNRVLSMGI